MKRAIPFDTWVRRRPVMIWICGGCCSVYWLGILTPPAYPCCLCSADHWVRQTTGRGDWRQ